MNSRNDSNDLLLRQVAIQVLTENKAAAIVATKVERMESDIDCIDDRLSDLQRDHAVFRQEVVALTATVDEEKKNRIEKEKESKANRFAIWALAITNLITLLAAIIGLLK